MIVGAVHYPAKPDRFEFDAEVASIFDDMAVRSIPGYTAMLATVAQVAKEVPAGEAWDFGVSTGNMLKAMSGAKHLRLCGCDISEPMLRQATRKVPGARLLRHDLRGGLPDCTPGLAIFAWTLQFIADHDIRAKLIEAAYEALEPGGALFVMEKFSGPETTERAYRAWRRGNGYSQAEIDAKTAALASVMFPWRIEDLMGVVAGLGGETRVLYRLFNFGGLIVRKPPGRPASSLP